ncbi:hypothetical protein SCHAM137S_06905 [Streptomyces chartreusis]
MPNGTGRSRCCRRSRGWAGHREVGGRSWTGSGGALEPARHAERYGPWGTAHAASRRWQIGRTWTRTWEKLQVKVDAGGVIAWEVSIDSTVCRACQYTAGPANRGSRSGSGGSRRPGGEPDDHALGRTRGGLTTKIHLAVVASSADSVEEAGGWIEGWHKDCRSRLLDHRRNPRPGRRRPCDDCSGPLGPGRNRITPPGTHARRPPRGILPRGDQDGLRPGGQAQRRPPRGRLVRRASARA